MTIQDNVATSIEDAWKYVTRKNSEGGEYISDNELAWAEKKTKLDLDLNGKIGDVGEDFVTGVRHLQAAHEFIVGGASSLSDYYRIATSADSIGGSTFTEYEMRTAELLTDKDIDMDGEIAGVTDPDTFLENIKEAAVSSNDATAGVSDPHEEKERGKPDTESTEVTPGATEAVSADTEPEGTDADAADTVQDADFINLFRILVGTFKQSDSEAGENISPFEAEVMESILDFDLDNNGTIGGVDGIENPSEARRAIFVARRLVDAASELGDENPPLTDEEFLRKLVLVAKDEIHLGGRDKVTSQEIRVLERITGADLDNDGNPHSISDIDAAQVSVDEILEANKEPLDFVTYLRKLIAEAKAKDSPAGSVITVHELYEILKSASARENSA